MGGSQGECVEACEHHHDFLEVLGGVVAGHERLEEPADMVPDAVLHCRVEGAAPRCDAPERIDDLVCIDQAVGRSVLRTGEQ